MALPVALRDSREVKLDVSSLMKKCHRFPHTQYITKLFQNLRQSVGLERRHFHVMLINNYLCLTTTTRIFKRTFRTVKKFYLPGYSRNNIIYVELCRLQTCNVRLFVYMHKARMTRYEGPTLSVG